MSFPTTFFTSLILAFFLSSGVWAQEKINLNTATESELVQLISVGPKKAKAIIDYRTTHGAFKTIEEFSEVKGIGQDTLDKNRQMIAISD